MKEIFNRVLFTLFFILIFFTPVIFTRFTPEIYEFPKMYFVYVVGSTIITTFFLKRILFSGSGVFNFVRPSFFVLSYFLIILFSVIFSSHTHTSVWGYYSRFNGGLASYAILFGLYLVGLNFFKKSTVRVYKDTMVLTLFPVSLYGIIQSFEKERVFSTFGQPNWLGAYLVMLMPLVLEKLFLSQRRLHKFIWFVLYLISMLCLVLSGSLSAFAGLAVSLAWLIVKYGYVSKKICLYAAAFLIPFLIYAAFNPFLRERITDAFVFSSNPQDYKVSDPGLIRYGLWKGTLGMIFSTPKNFLIGTGPETFPYRFPFYREDVLNYSSEWDFILNKPHNFYLEIWSESGFIALIFYLGILVKMIKNKNAYISSGAVGMAVSNFFGWPSVALSLVFWLWLSFVEVEDRTEREVPVK